MKRLIPLFSLIALGGCVVHERAYVAERRPVYVEQRTVAVDQPVIDGPGVVVVESEPPPVERVYVYDEGYPPGTYIYGGFVYYGGYRYERDVFVNRYVHENIVHHRYIDINENRRLGGTIVERHREEFQRTGGRRDPNYVAKLRAGQEQHAKAAQYGQEQKAKAGRYESDQAAKAGRYEADQKAKAGRYEGDQKVKGGKFEQEQKAKAGAYEQQQKAAAGREQPAKVNPQQLRAQQQERERAEAAQKKNPKKPEERN